MQTIQLIQISPDELVTIIANAVDSSFRKFFEEVKNLNYSKPQKELMSRIEVADFFSISLVTVHEWTNCGILSPYKIGKRTYYRSNEIFEVISNSKKK